jgi:hypothetical protein
MSNEGLALKILTPTKVQYSEIIKIEDYLVKGATQKSAAATRRPLDCIVGQ